MSPPMYPIYKYLEFPSQQRRSQNFNHFCLDPAWGVDKSYLPCVNNQRRRVYCKPSVLLRPKKNVGITPRKTSIEPKNDGLEDDFPFPGVDSQVPCGFSRVENLLSWCR